MATYKKRGYKPKHQVDDVTEVEIDDSDSTTKEVFETLDQSASKTEEWVAANQNYILMFIGAIAVVVLGYLAYNQFVTKPKEAEAANEMFYPQQYFDQALKATGAQRDSLFTMALNGGEGKYGFLNIIEEYSGTDQANIASYGAGMSYLNLQKYSEAIDHLENYVADDMILAALAKGGIGDAFNQLGQAGDALDYYEKALAFEANDFTTPRFLNKAGIAAMDLGQNDKALGYFQRIKNEYPNTNEGRSVDAFIGMVENK
jgi:tetratricopeptide (TPR) repeat protein